MAVFYQMDVKNAFLNGDLAIHTQAVKFVVFAVLFMALSGLLELGLKSLAQLLLNRVSLRVLMTLLFVRRSSAGITLILLYVLEIINYNVFLTK